MKNLILIVLLFILGSSSYAQTTATITSKRGLNFKDLQHILYFEGISLEKFNIKSADLKGKNFQIIIKEYIKGTLTKIDTVFNSREDEYFRIKSDSLNFAVLTKMTDKNYFKIHFQFDGFSSARKYHVTPETAEKFTLKNFFGAKPQLPIVFSKLNYVLAYMTPYVRPDKSEAYCEVAQSEINPEKLHEKYKLPHYFLIGINIE
ncbi:MAG: hypothetical protein REI64_02655 [Pedobacter sp.]|uniref:hypothetical protein n=1 Tax=Pedobacter sp. TaxID=1411316 RepID=UPI00280A377B|nr:hypothetical protein [Pedobacter sp.]MDQ8003670.1 hypothetical protein [Pedobacter sp.]